MKTKSILFVAALFACTACGSSKQTVTQVPQDVEIITYCEGPEYMTDGEYFRASGMGFSTSQQLANQKAMSAARATLAAALEVQIKSVTDSYLSSYEVNGDEEARGRYQTRALEVVNQTLTGVRTLCQKTTMSPDGKYKSYVAIELAGNDVATAVATSISNDEKLRTDFEYEKFKDVFEQEMAAYGK